MSADDQPPYRYSGELIAAIEARWQERWAAEGTFNAPNPTGTLKGPGAAERKPFYLLDMFPYPSGAGLHVGHPLGYIATDVFGRYQRMRGMNVLHALGYDSFGLPAEQYAIRTGTHPRETTETNVNNMRRQLSRLGLAHDSRRSVSTTDTEFYRWTQWIFSRIFDAYFDDRLGRARPIADLIGEFEAGERVTPTGQPWAELSEGERRSIVDSHRLAYVAEAPVNWCPGMGTVLANEEVTAEGRSDIGNFPVFKRTMRQWMMRITCYADRLLADLDRLDWPESIKLMQRNWIGRSEGAQIRFVIQGPSQDSLKESSQAEIEVFTTRADTLFGATFMVLAPEHPLVEDLVTPEQRAQVEQYRAAAALRTELDRQSEGREKTGVFTGGYAINPATQQPIPVWIADYVLMGYGTGAIMAVPAGDQRDFDFAQTFGLPIVAVQEPPAAWFENAGIETTLQAATWPAAFVGEGVYVNSANADVDLNGARTLADAKTLMHKWLEATGVGAPTVTYKLRDWLFSRQRYWGEPFPIVWDEYGPRLLPETELPVLLPDLDDFRPAALDPDDAESEPLPPLGRAEEWTRIQADLGDGERDYTRELNVMPQWAGSCWYEMRYLDPNNDQAFVDPEVERYWMGPDPELPGDPGGVDLYVGGVEHAVLHLLYARFWHKVLYDLGLVSSEEPFRRLFNQGMIQAYAYQDERGQYVEASEVVEEDGAWTWNGQPVKREYGKIGKSLKNVVTPDSMYDRYGADTFRLYEMSMGPLDASRPWATRDVVGMYRFLQRLWRNLIDEETGALRVIDEPAPEDLRRLLHRTIDGVGSDMEGLRFNTAIAKLIELNNALTKAGAPVPREIAEAMAVMISPLCPHLGEELWERLGHQETITYVPFPQVETDLLTVESVQIPIQINGKVRAKISVPVQISAEDLERQALTEPRVAEQIGDRVPRRVVVVPGRMVNVVL